MAPYSPFVIADHYNNSSPSARWIAGEKMGFDKELVLLASSLVGACPSSSGIERCFSTLGFTYGKRRSHLAVERARKLAFLQFLYVISLPENFYITDVFRQITVSLLLINSNYKMPTLLGVHRVILT